MAHAVIHGLARVPTQKLTLLDVASIDFMMRRTRLRGSLTQLCRDVAEARGLNPGTVLDIYRQRTWRKRPWGGMWELIEWVNSKAA